MGLFKTPSSRLSKYILVVAIFCVGFFNLIVYCFECVCPCVYPMWCSSTQCECVFDAICQSVDIACVLECNIAAMLYQSEMTVSIDQCLQYFSLSHTHTPLSFQPPSVRSISVTTILRFCPQTSASWPSYR